MRATAAKVPKISPMLRQLRLGSPHGEDGRICLAAEVERQPLSFVWHEYLDRFVFALEAPNRSRNAPFESGVDEGAMRLNFATAAVTPRADGETQDRVIVHRLPGGLVVLVADGAGGIPGGDVAADEVVRGVAEALVDDARAFLTAEGVVALLRRIDDNVERLPLAGETTAVLVVLREEQVYGASCGDSGAWIVDEMGLDELTADQKRKLRIGSGRAVPIPFGRGPLGGTLVVGSDGLFNYARPDVICAAGRGLSLTAAACALVACVRTVSGDLMDDVAVAMVRKER